MSFPVFGLHPFRRAFHRRCLCLASHSAVSFRVLSRLSVVCCCASFLVSSPFIRARVLHPALCVVFFCASTPIHPLLHDFLSSQRFVHHSASALFPRRSPSSMSFVFSLCFLFAHYFFAFCCVLRTTTHLRSRSLLFFVNCGNISVRLPTQRVRCECTAEDDGREAKRK